ncbi:MAG: AI-2E family transporter [Planctomycetales bacterium]|nr:AI-2E family transporter [Planctomycetales bacterium]
MVIAYLFGIAAFGVKYRPTWIGKSGMKPSSRTKSLTSSAQIIAGLSVVAALRLGQQVFVPLTLAVLLAFMLSPVVNRIRRLGTGNAIAVGTTAFLAFLLLGGTLALVGRELTELVGQLPQYKEELISKAKAVSGLGSGMGEELEQLADEVNEAIDTPNAEQRAAASEIVVGPRDSESRSGSSRISEIASTFFGGSQSDKTAQHDGTSRDRPLYTVEVPGQTTALTWAGTAGRIFGPLGTFGLVAVFVLFLLAYREDMRDRMIMVLSQGNFVTTTEALQEAAKRISKYLLALSIVNGSYGLVLGAGLYLIGLVFAPDGNFPNCVLWGVLAAMLRFVPYAGPLVAGSLPVVLSLAVFPGYSVTLAVLGLIVTLELVSNNIVEPWLYGVSTGLSAIAIIFAAVFWGWLWGPVGLLLSTPLTVCLVVLGRHVRYFQVFATLLGEASVIVAWQRFYQRLLAKDQHRAREFLEEEIERQGAIAALDSILAPTLKRIDRDLQQEHLDSSDLEQLFEGFELAIDKVAWPASTAVAPSLETEKTSFSVVEEHRNVQVVGCAAHNASEELLLKALDLSLPEVCIHRIDCGTLVEDVADKVNECQPTIVLIVVVPSGGFRQARLLSRAIRSQGYKGPIIACCCGRFRHFDRLYSKFRRSGANLMTTTFAQAALKIRSLLPARNVVNQELAASNV